MARSRIHIIYEISISDIPVRLAHFTKDLAMRNTADVIDGPSSYDLSPSGVKAVNSLVAIYYTHGRKGEVLFVCSIPDTTRDS
jgi:hypothetical protein